MNRFVALASTGLLGLAALSLSLSLSTGCGMDVGVGSTSTSGAGGHATSCSGGSGGVSGTGGGPIDYTTSVVSAGPATVGAGGGLPGAVCGGFPGSTCAANEYCDYPDNTCGSADGTGTCKPRPMACDAVLVLTCGCNGQIFSNECEANTAGQDVTTLGCKAPVGLFTCGEHFCDPKSQYCERQLSDVGTEPDTSTCKPLPSSCGGVGSCACLASVPCNQACSTTTDGGLKVICPGG